MDAGTIILILIAATAGLWIWQLWVTSVAKRQHEAKVGLSPARVADIVDSSFAGLLWRDWQGPGTINKRRRSANDSGPVVSVSIEPLADGGSLVTVWMSGWSHRLGIANFAGSASGQTKKILRRLEQA